jgi:hypothetical protein
VRQRNVAWLCGTEEGAHPAKLRPQERTTTGAVEAAVERTVGRGRRTTDGAADDELGEIGTRERIRPGDVEDAGHLEPGELEQRGRQVADLDRAADLVLVERDLRIGGRELVLRRLVPRPAEDQRGPYDQRGRVRRADSYLRLRLRPPVLGDRARLVLLDLRGPLPAF